MEQFKCITVEVNVCPCEREKKRKQEEQRWDESGNLVEEEKSGREGLM